MDELCALIFMYHSPLERLPVAAQEQRGYHRFDNDTKRWLESTLPPEANNNSQQIIEDEHHFIYSVHHWNENIVIPIMCGFGVLGNLMNLFIFIRRITQQIMETTEKIVIFGLIALTTCDFLFCIFTVIEVFVEKEYVIYTSKNLAYFYNLYGVCIQSILIKTRIWLTVIIAIERYVIVCHPIRFHQFIKVRYAIITIGLTCILWILFHLPMFWKHTIHQVQCKNETFHIADIARLYDNKGIGLAYTSFMITMGLIVPIVVLIFCNDNLLCALYYSSRIRGDHIHAHNQTPFIQITITIITLGFLLIICVGPAEIIHFYIFVAPGSVVDIASTAWSVIIAETCTNFLKSLNFSINFIVYFTIHDYFRSAMKEIYLTLLNYGSSCGGLRGREYSAVASSQYTPYLLQTNSFTSRDNDETLI